MDICAYWFGQATLVHVIIACASLSASTGMVYGPWSTGHTIAVVAGMGWVVASVGMVTVMVVAVNEQVHKNNSKEMNSTDLLFLHNSSRVQNKSDIQETTVYCFFKSFFNMLFFIMAF